MHRSLFLFSTIFFSLLFVIVSIISSVRGTSVTYAQQWGQHERVPQDVVHLDQDKTTLRRTHENTVTEEQCPDLLVSEIVEEFNGFDPDWCPEALDCKLFPPNTSKISRYWLVDRIVTGLHNWEFVPGNKKEIPEASMCDGSVPDHIAHVAHDAINLGIIDTCSDVYPHELIDSCWFEGLLASLPPLMKAPGEFRVDTFSLAGESSIVDIENGFSIDMILTAMHEPIRVNVLSFDTGESSPVLQGYLYHSGELVAEGQFDGSSISFTPDEEFIVPKNKSVDVILELIIEDSVGDGIQIAVQPHSDSYGTGTKSSNVVPLFIDPITTPTVEVLPKHAIPVVAITNQKGSLVTGENNLLSWQVCAVDGDLSLARQGIRMYAFGLNTPEVLLEDFTLFIGGEESFGMAHIWEAETGSHLNDLGSGLGGIEGVASGWYDVVISFVDPLTVLDTTCTEFELHMVAQGEFAPGAKLSSFFADDNDQEVTGSAPVVDFYTGIFSSEFTFKKQKHPRMVWTDSADALYAQSVWGHSKGMPVGLHWSVLEF